MNIETVEELCEYLADRAGIYGVDRIDFVADVEDRIRLAISNENVLSKLSQHDVIKNEVAVCDKCLGRGSIIIYDTCLDCEKCKGSGTQTVL